ncbi:hypothetical protein BGX26_006571 [Mortierella sp. AD094]|nr:hypothetical protein BGX26_006571 [Mortierella sp. AD094]
MGTLANGTQKRWYLTQTDEGVIGRLGKTPQSPILIPACRDWKCLLDIKMVEKGWYSMVFCISFKSTSTNLSDTLVIDAKELDQGKYPVYMAKKCRTIAGHNEIRTIARATPTRLRLFREIELQAGGWMEVMVNLGLSDLSDCELHYVEIDYGQAEPEDHMLYGEGAPQQIISVGLSRVHLQKTISIHTTEVSSTGNHAVTLCFDRGLAIVEVWSLQKYQEETSASPLVRHTKPYAQGSFKATLTNHPDFRDINLSVSSSGLQVVLHSNEPSINGIPCHVFRCDQRPADGYGPSSSFTMVEMPLPNSLEGFFGHGSFHCYTSKSSEEWKERYITCDGKSVEIYNPIGSWLLEGKMTLGSETNLEAALGVLQSLRGQYFAWTGESGVVSIWDIESRSQISYIHVEGSSLGASASISKDGTLVAISVKGRISVHETISGVKLGEYKEGLGEEKFFEVIIERDYFMLLDQRPPEDTNSDMVMRKIVRISDMSVVKTYPTHKDYSLQFPNSHGDQLLLYSQGSVVNIIKMSTEVVSTPDSRNYDQRAMRNIQVETFTHSNTQEYTSNSGAKFSLATSVSVIQGNWMTILKITRNASLGGGACSEKSLTIPLGSSHSLYFRIYMPESSRLVIVTGRYLQVWKLLDGADSKEAAELQFIWALVTDTTSHRIADICIRKVSSAMADDRGEQFTMTLQPPQWFRRLKMLPRDNASNVETITYPVSGADSLYIFEGIRVILGIRGAVDMYVDGDADCQRAIIRYLTTLVRPSPENTVSCVVTLCQCWNHEDRVYFERIMADLLPSDTVTWVPNAADSSKDTTVKRYGYDDPLAILLKTAETQPAAIGVAKVIMDYCVNHANSSKNLAFLSPIFGSMHEVMTLFPEEALECLSRIAFIPAKQRSYIIDNHIIVHPPTFRLQFWKPVQKLLCNTVDPIMQLHVSPTKPDSSNDKFTHPVFMASFDALWFYHDMAASTSVNRSVTMTSGRKKGESTEIEMTRMMTASTMIGTTATTTKPMRTSWWKTLYHMVMLKLKLQTKSKMYVECYDFNLEFFDNPAIAALVAYKWNTIGFSYWLIRFSFQCVFYSLVLIAALTQVYYTNRGSITGIFVAIIAMSVVFAWLEIQQAFQGWSRYKASTYNFLDLFSFLVPMAASIDQIIVISQGDPNGNSRLLSFSVLFVFLHMLFELRVYEGVCKYVTIIQQAIVEIKVFFVIFATGILAFTIGMLHLLRGCAVGESCPDDPDSTFTSHFFGALSSTYFFMGGLYDPISGKFDSQDWAFHIMMIIFFFFTVILMLNVLIALINVAFTKGDDGWRLAWVESRLLYIESAENMSYHIPGYRQSHSFFPQEIYFTATKQQVNAYKEKYGLKDSSMDERDSLKASGRAKDKTVAMVDARVEELQRQLILQQERMERQMQDLKDLLVQNQNRR